jgi:hypothetical protein
MARAKLVIIPGVGDRSRAYGVFAFVWNLLGFDVRVLPFGWVYTDAKLQDKTAEFLRLLDEFDKEPLYIIGVSAGGTAAVRVFARVNAVDRVITVGTPYKDFPDLKNQLLAASIRSAREDLSTLPPERKQRILSVYGAYDQVVPTHMSKPEGVKKLRLWSAIHAPTIFLALTFCSFRLRHFLKTGK